MYNILIARYKVYLFPSILLPQTGITLDILYADWPNITAEIKDQSVDPINIFSKSIKPLFSDIPLETDISIKAINGMTTNMISP